ncbi:hypothetical protein DFH09DRAFT_1271391 [Mycena vulgaris]|nr:hypothetical protein DFH09DRAFT_1271391 [Mycena vulgaris]
MPSHNQLIIVASHAPARLMVSAKWLAQAILLAATRGRNKMESTIIWSSVAPYNNTEWLAQATWLPKENNDFQAHPGPKNAPDHSNVFIRDFTSNQMDSKKHGLSVKPYKPAGLHPDCGRASDERVRVEGTRTGERERGYAANGTWTEERQGGPQQRSPSNGISSPAASTLATKRLSGSALSSLHSPTSSGILALPLLLAHKPCNVITPVLVKFPASLRSAATGASAVRASEWGAADVDVGTEQSGPDHRDVVTPPLSSSNYHLPCFAGHPTTLASARPRQRTSAAHRCSRLITYSARPLRGRAPTLFITRQQQIQVRSRDQIMWCHRRQSLSSHSALLMRHSNALTYTLIFQHLHVQSNSIPNGFLVQLGGKLGGGSDVEIKGRVEFKAKILVPTHAGFNGHLQLRKHQRAITPNEPVPLAIPQRGAESFAQINTETRSIEEIRKLSSRAEGAGAPGANAARRRLAAGAAASGDAWPDSQRASGSTSAHATAQPLARTETWYLLARDRRNARAALPILAPPPPCTQASHPRSHRSYPNTHPRASLPESPRVRGHDAPPRALPVPTTRRPSSPSTRASPTTSSATSPRLRGHNASPRALPVAPAPHPRASLTTSSPPRSPYPLECGDPVPPSARYSTQGHRRSQLARRSARRMPATPSDRTKRARRPRALDAAFALPSRLRPRIRGSRPAPLHLDRARVPPSATSLSEDENSQRPSRPHPAPRPSQLAPARLVPLNAARKDENAPLCVTRSGRTATAGALATHAVSRSRGQGIVCSPALASPYPVCDLGLCASAASTSRLVGANTEPCVATGLGQCAAVHRPRTARAEVLLVTAPPRERTCTPSSHTPRPDTRRAARAERGGRARGRGINANSLGRGRGRTEGGDSELEENVQRLERARPAAQRVAPVARVRERLHARGLVVRRQTGVGQLGKQQRRLRGGGQRGEEGWGEERGGDEFVGRVEGGGDAQAGPGEQRHRRASAGSSGPVDPSAGQEGAGQGKGERREEKNECALRGNGRGGSIWRDGNHRGDVASMKSASFQGRASGAARAFSVPIYMSRSYLRAQLGLERGFCALRRKLRGQK